MASDHHARGDAEAPREAPRPRAADEPGRPPLPADQGSALLPLRKPASIPAACRHVRRYICSTQIGGCGKLTVVADPVEAFVSEAVLHRLQSPLLPEAITRAPDGPEGAEWQAQAEEAQRQLDELAEMWAAKEITRGEWQKARPSIERRLTVARKRLAELNRQTAIAPFIGDAKRVREEWPSMTLTRQAEIVRALVDFVEVGPARRGYNRFDPSRLRPVWRV